MKIRESCCALTPMHPCSSFFISVGGLFLLGVWCGVVRAQNTSAWNVVTRLGTGESYYYNMKTGGMQLARPD